MEIEKSIINQCEEKLKSEEWEKITVSDITNACGISRQTFYYYFDDIFEVVYKIINLKIDEIAILCNNSETVYNSLLIILNALKENSYLLQKLRQTKYVSQIQNKVVDSLKLAFKDMLLRIKRKISISYDELDTYLELFACSLVAYMMKHSSEDIDVESIARILESLLYAKMSLFKANKD